MHGVAPYYLLRAWVLAAMLALEPAPPWLDTYQDTAALIAGLATQEPLWPGDDGPARTAALLVALSFYDSHFAPDVPAGLFQIAPHWRTADPLPLLAHSLDVCGDLSWYHHGGPDRPCRPSAKARQREWLARRLLAPGK